jgi:hypothetical protein
MRLFVIALAAVVVAVLAAGCGGSGTRSAEAGGGNAPASQTVAYDARRGPLACINAHGIKARLVGSDAIQVEPDATGPYVRFKATAAAATEEQLAGKTGGAELIGYALLYVRSAPDAELAPIESCLAKIAKG